MIKCSFDVEFVELLNEKREKDGKADTKAIFPLFNNAQQKKKTAQQIFLFWRLVSTFQQFNKGCTLLCLFFSPFVKVETCRRQNDHSTSEAWLAYNHRQDSHCMPRHNT